MTGSFFHDVQGIALRLAAPMLAFGDREFLCCRPASQLVVIDGTWTKISSIVHRLSESTTATDGERLLFRSLPASLVTAYPRKSKLFDAFRSYLLAADGDGTEYAKAAGAVGMSGGAFRVAVHRARKRFKDLVREEVRLTVGRSDAVDREVAELVRIIAPA